MRKSLRTLNIPNSINDTGSPTQKTDDILKSASTGVIDARLNKRLEEKQIALTKSKESLGLKLSQVETSLTLQLIDKKDKAMQTIGTSILSKPPTRMTVLVSGKSIACRHCQNKPY
ncbi:hypothetical protein TSAR_012448 [Trichomalopsis sarcophagae]|uniref:Uncharacterized protein n=1 Tax=Trichomalopsis sarcophagae TaxID=543379 RepID=A0A232F786_9HYME|nr:hypothetical protein TSAR_012448 [Trichomalopsis sarcophagae]